MRTRRWLGVVVTVALLGACGKPKSGVPTGSGATGGGSGEGARAEGVALPPGWFATYTDGSGGAEASACVASPAFWVAPGDSIHPAIAPDAFGAAATCSITITEAGRYRFGAGIAGGTLGVSVYDAGGLEVASLKGATGPEGATPWVHLAPAAYTLTYRFTRAGGGDEARLAPTWEREQPATGAAGNGFRREPIPPGVARVAAFQRAEAGEALRARRGRVKLGEFGCTHCHAESHERTPGEGDFALTRRAPTLGEIGRRASPEFLSRWVRDPQAVKPGSGMPTLFRPGEVESEDIVHFLVSLSGPVEFEPVATESAVLARGREIYHTIGCVACHGALDSPRAVFDNATLADEAPSEPVRHALGDLSGKWRAVALAEFLMDPARTHPGGRMPSMGLARDEADLLATYLVARLGSAGASEGGATHFTLDPARAERGAAAFATRGCAACHEIGHSRPEITNQRPAPTLASLREGRGCLDTASTTTPRYALSDDDRADLGAAIRSLASWTGSGRSLHASRIDRARLTIDALNCRGCHEVEGTGGVPASLAGYFRTIDEVELGDEGRLPPILTHVGWKLNSTWIRAVLEESGRARPYMTARMPQFGSALGDLAEGLGALSGVPSGADLPEDESTDARVIAGLRLVGGDGLNCISCHAFGDLPPAGTPGPALTTMAERIRHEWWSSYIHDPARFKPGTRMTKFFERGRGAVTDVLGGDADAQAAAIWAYLNLGDFMPVPEGQPTGEALMLTATAAPRVFRTFMKNAGSRGIAIGYPVGVHFAFDAGTSRLVEAWRGSFIDASGAWKGRGGTVAGGQGDVVWSAPPGPSLVVAPARPDAWPSVGETAWLGGPDESRPDFKGYRLHGDGAPEFRWSIGGVEVSEWFEGVRSGEGVRRRFEVRGVPPGSVVWFRAAAGEGASEVVEEVRALDNVFETRNEGDSGEQVIGVVPARDDAPVVFEVVLRGRVK